MRSLATSMMSAASMEVRSIMAHMPVCDHVAPCASALSVQHPKASAAGQFNGRTWPVHGWGALFSSEWMQSGCFSVISSAADFKAQQVMLPQQMTCLWHVPYSCSPAPSLAINAEPTPGLASIQSSLAAIRNRIWECNSFKCLLYDRSR